MQVQGKKLKIYEYKSNFFNEEIAKNSQKFVTFLDN
jgi:hypothetical protein